MRLEQQEEQTRPSETTTHIATNIVAPTVV